MKPATQCLKTSEMEALLAGSVPPSQSEFWEEHLSSCNDCRLTMADRVGDQDWWRDAEQSLMDQCIAKGREPSGDAPDGFRRSNKTGEGESSDDDRENTDELLRLLGPTDDPRMLGRIGSYEILGVLGRGGIGIVFKAFDAPLNRYVAIKMLLPHLATSGAARKRFEREGQAAAAVIDDHVLPIYAVSQWQNVPYLVMQYSSGKNLQRRIDDEGPLAVKEILRIGVQAARGLAAAHAQGLVHRDVKPSNMLLDGSVERVMLTDFGLARAVDDASITRTGMIAGTPQYMSPEQARGQSVDARSDLFGLGCVLYALCTGHPPFRAENSFAILRLITDEEPRPIQVINPDIPDWLCWIIRKLMSKEAEERFASAEDVAELLEDCLAHVQQPTTTPLPKRVAKLVKSFNLASCESNPNSLDHFRYPPIGKLIGIATFAISLIFTGVLIVLELNQGTLTIECDSDDIPIRIMQNDELVERLTVSRNGTTTRIAAGNYTVELEETFDAFTVENNAVTISRGGTETVRVTQAEDATVVSYEISDLLEKHSPIPIEDQIESLIQFVIAMVEPDSWNNNRFSIAPSPQNTGLLVRQADATHNKLRLLFERIRARKTEVKSDFLDLIDTAHMEVTNQVRDLNARLAALPEHSEDSPESKRLRVRLKRSEELLGKLSNEAKKVQSLDSGEASRIGSESETETDLEESLQDALSADAIKVLTDGRFGTLKVHERISLQDAVTKFNEVASKHDLGRQQPQLTVEEIVGAFRLWVSKKECNEATRKDFQQVIDSRMLRPGHILQFNTQHESEGHKFSVWQILFGDDDSYAWFKIRNVTLISHIKSDEERNAWEQNKASMAKSFREFKRNGNVNSVVALEGPDHPEEAPRGSKTNEDKDAIAPGDTISVDFPGVLPGQPKGQPVMSRPVTQPTKRHEEQKTAAESRDAFHQQIPQSGTVLVMFDDGSKLSQQMSPVASRVAKSASIELIEQPLADAPWIKSASSHVSRSGSGGPQFVLIKDRQQVGIRYGLLTEKRLREFVRTADNWLTPHATGVNEASLVRIDCYINPGNGNAGKQVGGAHALTTAVVAVHEDQALLLGPDSIAEYLDGRYACVAMVRDESGESKQLPLDVIQIGWVELLDRENSDEKPAANPILPLADGSTEKPPLDTLNAFSSIADSPKTHDTGAAIYHIRGAFGLTPVRLADVDYLPAVNQSVLSGGFLRDRRSRPVVDFGSPLLWQSQIVESNDDVIYGIYGSGPRLTNVICPIVPAPVGFTFSKDGLLIGKYELGMPNEKDMSHTVFQPVTTHSVLMAAVDKVENEKLRAELMATLKPR